ncbi:class I SAM-dependent methyltransferase [Amycolatopsis tolypomycina]|uniref:class I SAM-dependent methyltransferase n=1 Tax=Amycolatopsis tolypomycina TaxID=208445 RepID=UPI0033B982AE
MSRTDDWRRLSACRIPSTLSWHQNVLGSLAGTNILDVGCGPAPDFSGLDHIGGLRVGVDFNHAAAPSVRGSKRCDLVVIGDATELPFVEDSFGIVLCKAVLTAVVAEDKCTKVLVEACRVTRPGGTVLVSDFLLNDDVEYFRARYGKLHSLPYGAFQVTDRVTGVNYVARHFEDNWIRNQGATLSSLRVVDYFEHTVTTRSGRQSRGFTAIICPVE